MNKLELIAGLEIERDQLQKRLNSLEDTILTLKQTLNFDGSSSPKNGYQVSRPSSNNTAYDKYKAYFDAKGNKERAIAILKAEGRFLHMRQIVKLAQSLEPNADPDTVKGKISQGIYALGNLDPSPIVCKVVGASKTSAFWGSKNWLNEAGEIKPEHMYDEGELSARKSEALEI